MANPEIHIHTHLHFDPDVATFHPPTPAPKPQTIRYRELEEAGQTSVFEQTLAEEPVPVTEIPIEIPTTASAVALKPQEAHDQRLEISRSSTRNEHLMNVDSSLSSANSEDAAAERSRIGILKTKRSPATIKKSAEAHRKVAKVELASACGNCAITGCQIRNNFIRFERVHESADKPKTANQESRKAWRGRLLADPNAPCLPPKQKPVVKNP